MAKARRWLVRQPNPVDLGDRGRGHRVDLKRRENLLVGSAERSLDRRRDDQAGGPDAGPQEPPPDHAANARWAVLMPRHPPP
jgi:hypothetical protein